MIPETSTDGLPGDVHADLAAGYAAIEIRQVITRACTQCGSPRDPERPETPCASCGLDTPAIQHDLGIVSAVYADPEQQSAWQRVGKQAAAARTAAANLYHHMIKE